MGGILSWIIPPLLPVGVVCQFYQGVHHEEIIGCFNCGAIYHY